MLEPDGDLLRFVLDGSARKRFSPRFNVLDTAAGQVWVYVNNEIHESLERDSLGNLLFMLPGEVSDRRFVEVILRRGP